MPSLTIAHGEHRGGKLHCVLQNHHFPNLGILLTHLRRTIDRNEESNAPLMYGPELENCWEILSGTIMYIWDKHSKRFTAYEMLSVDKALENWSAAMQRGLPKDGFTQDELGQFLALAEAA